MCMVATFVPFSYLDDLISSGILVAFCMTNSCLILMRHESPVCQRPHMLSRSLIAYHVLCLTSSMILSHVPPGGGLIAIPFLFLTVGVALFIYVQCPKSENFGGSVLLHRNNSNMEGTNSNPNSNNNSNNDAMNDDSDLHPNHSYFETPCVPLLPCAGIFVNWYLVSRLELFGLGLLLLYLGLVVACYFAYCAHCNSVGHATGWRRGGIYHTVVVPHHHEAADNESSSLSVLQSHDGIMLRSIISLPNVKPKTSTTTITFEDISDLPSIT